MVALEVCSAAEATLVRLLRCRVLCMETNLRVVHLQ